jgi:hypothetical protein
MAFQKIKIITAEHPDILEVRVNEWLETMQEVNNLFEVVTTNITTLRLYNAEYITCCIRYSIIEKHLKQ